MFFWSHLLYWSFFTSTWFNGSVGPTAINYGDEKQQRVSKHCHHRLNHKSTHQLSGSHSDTGFKSPHPHLVIIIRPSTKLIGAMLQWTNSTQSCRQASHAPLFSTCSLSYWNTHICPRTSTFVRMGVMSDIQGSNNPSQSDNSEVKSYQPF